MSAGASNARAYAGNCAREYEQRFATIRSGGSIVTV